MSGQHQHIKRPRSPRMRRLAEHLSVIRISLDPPSPPPTFETCLQSPTPTSEIPPSWKHFEHQTIESSNLLQVPRLDPMPDDVPRSTNSPPPRRCSNASSFSENSSMSFSLNASYQNLLSPSGYFTRRSQSRSTCSSNHSYSDDNETPPNEFVFLVSRPHSAQSTPVESISPTVLLSPVLSRPVRSLSHSGSASPFLRQAPPVSDSESELLPWTLGHRNRQHSRTSRPSDSSSPLATPPITCGSPTPALYSNSPTKLLRSGGSGELKFYGFYMLA